MTTKADLAALRLMGYKRTVRKFGKLMVEQLKANLHKSGWRSTVDNDFLIAELEKNLAQLKLEIVVGGSFEASYRRAANIANFAMMIWDRQRSHYQVAEQVESEDV